MAVEFELKTINDSYILNLKVKSSCAIHLTSYCYLVILVL